MDFFLRLERCALAVRARLAEYALTQETPNELTAVITARATRELQRALSARGQLARIAHLAKQHHWKIVTLKGGVTIAEGGQVDVHDIDVLMLPDAGKTLATLLDTSGFTTNHEARPPHHLSARYAANDVSIEIHHTIPGVSDIQTLLDRALPLNATPSLWRLGHADHLWHLLLHATLQHPERRGNLRDVTIIARAIAATSSDDLTQVAAKIDAHSDAAILRPMFTFARDVAERQYATDPFVEHALRKYTFCQRYDGRSTNIRERTVRFLCEDRSLLHALWEDFALPNDVPSMFAPINWLNRNTPWLTAPIRQCLRVGRLGVVVALAVQNAWDVRQVTRRWREVQVE